MEHLPPESATKTAIRNAIPAADLERMSEGARPDLGQWSGVETLLAQVKDEITLLRHVLVAANGGKPGEFHPTPRPGIPPKSAQQRKQLTDEQRRALDPRLRDQP
ncbi:hypothetical protein ACGFZB_28580 [Streptomyces cinerochromogenes]|uniref:Transposase n=1 Tax=Streptomyces cinerochromogenes TaxID=66422 RepID=A0ABW7BBR8_9ACTN